jgi:aryl-alcohol dehydrogenase-like predicted oxidoreductase
VHWPDPETPMAETARAMGALYDAGLIRAIGVSNFSPAQMDEFAQFAPLHVVQPPYNLFERGIETDVLPYVREHGLTALTYGALCRGLLSGAIREDTTFSGDDLRGVDPKFQPPRVGQYLRAVARLDDLARTHFGKRVIQLALRWVLDQPGVGAALWGARRPDQLDALSAALGFTLDDATKAEIERIVAEEVHEAIGPEFMAPPLHVAVAGGSAS